MSSQGLKAGYESLHPVADHSLIVFLDNNVNKIYRSIDSLRPEFPVVEVFTTETEFFALLETRQPSVVFLQLDLIPRDAIALLIELRHHQALIKSYIVIYSAKDDDFIQELAYNSGVDRFINFHDKPNILKPFLRNLLRRKVALPKQKKQISIDAEKYLVFSQGKPVQLPRKEFILFNFLHNNPEKFFSKKEIALEIWHDELIARKRTIEVHIYKIRQFLGSRIILSKKGEGYKINKKLIG